MLQPHTRRSGQAQHRAPGRLSTAGRLHSRSNTARAHSGLRPPSRPPLSPRCARPRPPPAGRRRSRRQTPGWAPEENAPGPAWTSPRSSTAPAAPCRRGPPPRPRLKRWPPPPLRTAPPAVRRLPARISASVPERPVAAALTEPRPPPAGTSALCSGRAAVTWAQGRAQCRRAAGWRLSAC